MEFDIAFVEYNLGGQRVRCPMNAGPIERLHYLIELGSAHLIQKDRTFLGAFFLLILKSRQLWLNVG
ncbi:hypothetical protein LAV73_08670 [Lysinibacillus xylanilyticus]|uniref:hypothetical protein n=1 Tax=Lysinibacillus xylanilyticus TaxID=582475 RepID=UPI002B242BA5|nr:hypothetical protein [Lysinibacillus xylanilyticus]MEB2280072.1 hypothetical protein [Lysinibacillus xylanilyticus]